MYKFFFVIHIHFLCFHIYFALFLFLLETTKMWNFLWSLNKGELWILFCWASSLLRSFIIWAFFILWFISWISRRFIFYRFLHFFRQRQKKKFRQKSCFLPNSTHPDYISSMASLGGIIFVTYFSSFFWFLPLLFAVVLPCLCAYHQHLIVSPFSLWILSCYCHVETRSNFINICIWYEDISFPVHVAYIHSSIVQSSPLFSHSFHFPHFPSSQFCSRCFCVIISSPLSWYKRIERIEDRRSFFVDDISFVSWTHSNGSKNVERQRKMKREK